MADSGMPNRAYTLLSNGKDQVGGLMPIPQEAADRGARPMWTGYIGVADVDAAATNSRRRAARSSGRRWIFRALAVSPW